MSVNPDVAGRSYPPAPPFQVGREAVRGFAEAVQAQHPAHHDVAAARALGHADLVAPPTFAVVIAQRAEAAVLGGLAHAAGLLRRVIGILRGAASQQQGRRAKGDQGKAEHEGISMNGG